MLETSILENLEKLPESLKQEVLHYTEFLVEKYGSEKLEAETPKKKRRAGILKSKIWMSDDFDDPLSTAEESESESSSKRGGFGIWKGKVKIAEDFDAPLEDFKEYME